ncbi:hypothetical protein EJB05_55388 [Eragrostis curvula]|uniref:Uncharacterized protein n=1 Tax=Eragrostis curvula TaxID=38414 RepID=A0A5J9SJV6_9POAL|nr:hypothetical protein EJB05_55388 [Eragrostis curvula]
MWAPGRQIRAEKIKEVARSSDPPVELTTGDALEDAIQFLVSVKRDFQPKYQELIAILAEFGRGSFGVIISVSCSLDTDVVASRVRVLFDGHPHVIRGFNLTTEDALRFLESVKHEFRDKYDELMALLLEFRSGSMDADSVISRVKVLFEGHPRLIIGFNVFLPERQKIQVLDGEETAA